MMHLQIWGQKEACSLCPQKHLLKVILSDHLDAPAQKLVYFKVSFAFLLTAASQIVFFLSLSKLLSTSYNHQ